MNFMMVGGPPAGLDDSLGMTKQGLSKDIASDTKTLLPGGMSDEIITEETFEEILGLSKRI